MGALAASDTVFALLLAYASWLIPCGAIQAMALIPSVLSPAVGEATDSLTDQGNVGLSTQGAGYVSGADFHRRDDSAASCGCWQG